MRPVQLAESAYAESAQLRGRMLCARDAETTADLPDENTLDENTLDENTLDLAPAAHEGTTVEAVPAMDYLPLDAVQKQRGWGFFAFVGCALIGTMASIHSHTGSSHPDSERISTPLRRADTRGVIEAQPVRSEAGAKTEIPVARQANPAASRKRDNAAASASVVTFGTRSFDTSERALAAVFIVERSQSATGPAFVKWAAYSGSADAGIDFSDASGTIRFADGQRQLAIYVPLRNDLLKEDDETFKVCMRSPRQARIGGTSCAEATIRDDDICRDPSGCLLRASG